MSAATATVAAQPAADKPLPAGDGQPSRQVLETPCGRVRLTEPTGAGGDIYWRLDWYDDDDRRHQTTGGRTVRTARAKAAKVLKRLDEGAQAEGRERLGGALDAYVAFCNQTFSANHSEV